MHPVTLFTILLVTWFILSGHLTFGFVVLGIFSSAFATFLCWRMYKDKPLHLNLEKFIKRYPVYLGWLTKEITLSALQVTGLVWQIKPKITPHFSWVKASQGNETGLALFANSITLTPGTVSVVMGDGKIQVHALTHAGMKSLQQGEMDQRVKEVTG